MTMTISKRNSKTFAILPLIILICSCKEGNLSKDDIYGSYTNTYQGSVQNLNISKCGITINGSKDCISFSLVKENIGTSISSRKYICYDMLNRKISTLNDEFRRMYVSKRFYSNLVMFSCDKDFYPMVFMKS